MKVTDKILKELSISRVSTAALAHRLCLNDYEIEYALNLLRKDNKIKSKEICRTTTLNELIK